MGGDCRGQSEQEEDFENAKQENGNESICVRILESLSSV
jgi:hypothetical protein